MNMLNVLKPGIVALALFGLFLGMSSNVLAHGTHTTSITAGGSYCLLRVTVDANESGQLTGRAVGSHPAGNRLLLTAPTEGGEHALICSYGLVKFITNLLLVFIIVVAGLFISYAAFLFVMAGQSPDKRSKARDFFIYAIIGLVVAFLASFIPTMVRGIIGV